MKRRILVTNDDGIHSAGLRTLVKHLCRDFELLVVAPEREQSAAGHSITLHKPLRMQPASVGRLPVKAFQTNGTPADCVVLGVLLDELPVDLVISGINAGANLGEELFYSGTVSAAVEGAIQGLPAFAVSVAARDRPMLEPAAKFALHLAHVVLEMGLPEGSLLNVNVPNLPADQLGPAVVTRLGRRNYANQIEQRTDPWGRPYFWFSGEPAELDSGPGTDIAAVREGKISVTPIHTDLTDYSLVEKLRAEEERLSVSLAGAASDGEH
jgi:5'-nucleotidase